MTKSAQVANKNMIEANVLVLSYYVVLNDSMNAKRE